MKKNIKHNWGVIRDTDVGTHVYHPWLLEEHAIELADILNKIETHRIEVIHKGRRDRGDGDFYTAKKMVDNT